MMKTSQEATLQKHLDFAEILQSFVKSFVNLDPGSNKKQLMLWKTYTV